MNSAELNSTRSSFRAASCWYMQVLAASVPVVEQSYSKEQGASNERGRGASRQAVRASQKGARAALKIRSESYEIAVAGAHDVVTGDVGIEHEIGEAVAAARIQIIVAVDRQIVIGTLFAQATGCEIYVF